jgi:hypothetical protein
MPVGWGGMLSSFYVWQSGHVLYIRYIRVVIHVLPWCQFSCVAVGARASRLSVDALAFEWLKKSTATTWTVLQNHGAITRDSVRDVL